MNLLDSEKWSELKQLLYRSFKNKPLATLHDLAWLLFLIIAYSPFLIAVIVGNLLGFGNQDKKITSDGGGSV